MAKKPYPDWFEHSRCSLCEHFQKKTITCRETKTCNHKNKHKLFRQKLGAVIGQIKNKAPVASCSHPNLQPYMQMSGKRTFKAREDRKKGDMHYIDWTGNIINAHYLKVIKYWCPTCGVFITPPSDTED